jgi:hypothetical protein
MVSVVVLETVLDWFVKVGLSSKLFLFIILAVVFSESKLLLIVELV